MAANHLVSKTEDAGSSPATPATCRCGAPSSPGRKSCLPCRRYASIKRPYIPRVHACPACAAPLSRGTYAFNCTFCKSIWRFSHPRLRQTP
jgi:hypothetical protein